MSRLNSMRKIFVNMEDQQEFICGECVQEPFLKEHKLTVLYSPRVCIGCGKTVECAFSSMDLAGLCRRNLENYFEIDVGIFPGYELSLVDILGQALLCCNKVALASIANHLEIEGRDDDDGDESNDFFAEGQEYQRRSAPFDDEEHERWYVLGDWHRVATQLTHGRRFFNKRALSLFGGILREALSAENVSVPGLRPVVKRVAAGFEFFRARIAKDSKERQSFFEAASEQLGAPPAERAANNRMSAAGIPHLYLSADSKTCVAEVRPSIGEEVVVGKFLATRDLKIFDLSALSGRLTHRPLSFFDASHEERHMLRLLLSHLHTEIGRPVKSHDTDYLMTQALAEYVRFECDEHFDGIAFQSVQNSKGVNYMLFDSSSDEERCLADWKPRFDVEIANAGVAIVRIEAVSYSMTPQDLFGSVVG